MKIVATILLALLGLAFYCGEAEARGRLRNREHRLLSLLFHRGGGNGACASCR